MKLTIVILDLLLMSSSAMAAWCTSYGISTSFSCGAGRFQFCCDGPGSPVGDFNIWRGDCTRPGGDSRNCGDGGFVSCGDENDRVQIFNDDHSLHVTRNLENGLRQFLQLLWFNRGLWIWIGAVCIDQGNEPEKNAQLQMISAIYQQAGNIVVWLGPAGDTSDEANKYLHTTSVKNLTEYIEARDHVNPQTALANRNHASMIVNFMMHKWSVLMRSAAGTLNNEESYAEMRQLNNFFNRPYWRRLWIIQQLAMPCRHAHYLWKQRRPVAIDKDRIYGMLAVPSLPRFGIQVDLSKSTGEVFIEFANACINCGYSADIFQLLDGTAASLLDDFKLPFWCANFNSRPGRRRMRIIEGNWQASGYRQPAGIDSQLSPGLRTSRQGSLLKTARNYSSV
ncbi:heterokaryon incompatibility protein-domain-containing protein [Dactylonectria estremocensis]|uniref:Heterokaryon incompatibility protein-domain-containing protein n=1 Tax=Dactylonectria estremocensis TaxID=1079267 RepID=A0A9P9EK21_9HYPO|nr:heterokaryon incompatibility protein-domain-containing protein [Dactylonectria estremocensis]